MSRENRSLDTVRFVSKHPTNRQATEHIIRSLREAAEIGSFSARYLEVAVPAIRKVLRDSKQLGAGEARLLKVILGFFMQPTVPSPAEILAKLGISAETESAKRTAIRAVKAAEPVESVELELVESPKVEPVPEQFGAAFESFRAQDDSAHAADSPAAVAYENALIKDLVTYYAARNGPKGFTVSGLLEAASPVHFNPKGESRSWRAKLRRVRDRLTAGQLTLLSEQDYRAYSEYTDNVCLARCGFTGLDLTEPKVTPILVSGGPSTSSTSIASAPIRPAAAAPVEHEPAIVSSPMSEFESVSVDERQQPLSPLEIHQTCMAAHIRATAAASSYDALTQMAPRVEPLSAKEKDLARRLREAGYVNANPATGMALHDNQPLPASEYIRRNGIKL